MPKTIPLTPTIPFRQPVVVNGRPRILYVESHEASAQYLRRALESEGLIVDVIAPESSA